ncbi:MAG: PKD domain-containing protein [Bacteroidales bacterium]|nr:PKD domain-containing protein [Bacteroidales bacterium]
MINNWYWRFGDDNDTLLLLTPPTVTHTYSQPGTFLVSLTLGAQRGCSHTRVIPVTISASRSPFSCRIPARDKPHSLPTRPV